MGIGLLSGVLASPAAGHGDLWGFLFAFALLVVGVVYYSALAIRAGRRRSPADTR